MAEPDSILQLGIEAAREGKKDEARQLFRLLTRQEPDNAQGWLWLAGVAENREERQNALERVIILDPGNEMAVKGLQALGVNPESVRAAPPPPPPPVAVEPPPPPARTPVDDDDPFGDDDPFAELNNLSDTLAADTSGPVRRAEPTPVVAVDADGNPLPPRESVTTTTSTTTTRPSGGSRTTSRTTTSTSNPRRGARVDDDEYEAPRKGLSPLLGVLLFLVGLGMIGLLIAFLFPNLFGGGDSQAGAAEQTAVAETAVAGGVLGGGAPTTDPNAPPQPTTDPNAPPQPTTDPNAPPQPTTDPNAPPQPTTDPNAPPQPTTDPNAPPVAPPGADVSQANPAVINANTPLQSEGWTYDFNQPTYAASIIGNLGQFTPNNGRFVVVLAFAINGTGRDQSIPGNFFVLKDAQGRVWEARPEVSQAYVVPGVNADLYHTQNLPADGITRSVAIIFDVAPDATDLVFFARSNPGQGWIVLRSV